MHSLAMFGDWQKFEVNRSFALVAIINQIPFPHLRGLTAYNISCEYAKGFQKDIDAPISESYTTREEAVVNMIDMGDEQLILSK